MPRKRQIDRYIIQVLQNAPSPLRFSEIALNLSHLLKKEIKNPVIAENLARLMEQKFVEKIIEDGRLKYRLTQQFYAKQTLQTLQGLLNNIEKQHFLSSLETTNPPSIIFTPQVRNKPQIVSFFNPAAIDFNNPADIIARRMMEAFLTYPPEKQEEAEKLLLWAYWAGVQSKISDKDWRGTIDAAEGFAEEEKRRQQEGGGVLCRIKAEEALLKIIGIVKELIQKPNLQEFFNYLFEKEEEVKRLKGEIAKQIHRSFIGGGENLFDEFLNFHAIILRGLSEAKLLPREVEGEEYDLRFLSAYEEVWNAFFLLLLERLDRGDLSNIRGAAGEAATTVRYYGDGFRILRALPYQSRVFLVYLWGYPEVIMLSDKSFLPNFEEWLKALKSGWLDHRSHLFSRSVEQSLLKAYRNVTRGKPPPDEKIDIEAWTLYDLYRNHPRGKDPVFYMEILNAIRGRQLTTEEQFH